MSSDLEARFNELVSILHATPSSIFDPFDIYRTTYHSCGTDIGADVLVPKGPCPIRQRPVIVRLHGGFLVTGSSLFPAWFSKWILELALEQSAIIISPNYRLLPEVKGKDILEDMKNFWDWYKEGGPQQSLQAVGRPDVQLDLGQLLLIGESAGGYLALQSVLLGFVWPSAIAALYPVLDLLSDHFTRCYPKPIVGVPNFPSSVVDEFLASMSEGTVVTEADPPTRLDLAFAVAQNGRYLDLLGDDPDLFILEKLKQAKLSVSNSSHGTLFPPLYVLHGEQDSAVPVEGTLKFIQCLKDIDPAAKIHTAIRAGDHGFDSTASAKDDWMRDGLDFVVMEWIRQNSTV